jgi:hypothetical protein
MSDMKPYRLKKVLQGIGAAAPANEDKVLVWRKDPDHGMLPALEPAEAPYVHSTAATHAKHQDVFEIIPADDIPELDAEIAEVEAAVKTLSESTAQEESVKTDCGGEEETCEGYIVCDPSDNHTAVKES